ncbi:MAG: alpha-L-glutamate ligase-like protein [Pseudomonadota bacterium]
MMISSAKRLWDAGVIGINERNESLIGRLNQRRAIRLVDDKRLTKTLAEGAGIPTPTLYGTATNLSDCRKVTSMICSDRGAVIKPAHGSQGKGILILLNQTCPRRPEWQRNGGKPVAEHDIHFHVQNVMSGMYSLGGEPDTAMVEERIRFDTVFGDIAIGGVPDIRIVAVKGVPIAAMLRVPTEESDGKANLHQGGVGVGIHIPTGVTHSAVQHGKRLQDHPDTGAPLNGISIPGWHEMLEMAAKSYEVTGLGYLGVDIVIDKDKGPMLLELNARPGLAIQIANGQGLRQRVQAVGETDTLALGVPGRVKLAIEICAQQGH